MTGGKKGSDLTNRLKRPLKGSSHAPKASASPDINAPPKAALASTKSKKDEVHRRKNPLGEMLHRKANGEASSVSLNPFAVPELGQVPERRASSGILPNSHTRAANRIAELEQALAAAKEQQRELREELEKVQQHDQEYIDTVEDYVRQLSDTYSNGARAVTPTPILPRPNNEASLVPPRLPVKPRDTLEDQNRELRSKVTELQGQLVMQDEAYRARMDEVNPSRGIAWNELTARLHHTEKESQDRLQQLLDLKHSISSMTRSENQITDSELAERFDQLYHRVREWVVSNLRKAKPAILNPDVETARALEMISVEYDKTKATDRLAFYQAVVSSALMHIFNEPVCLGIPETGPLSTIRQLAAYIQNAGSDYGEWRRTTIRALHRSEARHALEEEKNKLLHRLADDVQHRLQALTLAHLSLTAQSSLLGILNMAADLQHMLSLQKAHYEVHFFRNQQGSDVYLDEQRMEPVNDVDSMDEDGDSSTGRNFIFCVFACLEKCGDENGEHMDTRNILLKARVCCGVG